MSDAIKFAPSAPLERPEALTAEGLRASHEIIGTLEKSKSSSEQILDLLPDVLIIMTPDGRILRGNVAASRILEIDIEKLINKNFFDLLESHARKVLRNKIDFICRGDEQQQVQVELSVTTPSGLTKDYLWTLSLFKQITARRGKLITILGKDVTEIKEYEKSLSKIYSAIPLGILTVNRQGKIDGPFSLTAEYLLGRDNLVHKNIFEILFASAWDSLSPKAQEGAQKFIPSIGLDALSFDAAKSSFPIAVQLTRATPEGQKPCWLHVHYHPIVLENVVDKVMIVLEDRSEIIESRAKLEKMKSERN